MGMMKKQDKARSYYADVFQKFRRHRMAMVGLYVISLVLLAVFVLPPLLGLDPITSTRGKAFLLPGGEFPLGLDGLGRDNLARLLYGGRTSIQVGLLSTAVSILIGVPLGLCAGYFRGWFEALVMRLVDVFMSFPSMILILVLVSVVGPSIWSVTLIIGIMGWPDFARIIYGNVLSVSHHPRLHPPECVLPGAGDDHLSHRFGHFAGGSTELSRYGGSAPGGFSGQHSKYGAVADHSDDAAMVLGAAGDPAGADRPLDQLYR